MLRANFMDLCFAEPELLASLFCSCALDPDPMTFIYELRPYSLEIYQMLLLKVIDRQTNRHDPNTTPLRGQKKQKEEIKHKTSNTKQQMAQAGTDCYWRCYCLVNSLFVLACKLLSVPATLS